MKSFVLYVMIAFPFAYFISALIWVHQDRRPPSGG
jgi:hypothetical protein